MSSNKCNCCLASLVPFWCVVSVPPLSREWHYRTWQETTWSSFKDDGDYYWKEHDCVWRTARMPALGNCVRHKINDEDDDESAQNCCALLWHLSRDACFISHTTISLPMLLYAKSPFQKSLLKIELLSRRLIYMMMYLATADTFFPPSRRLPRSHSNINAGQECKDLLITHYLLSRWALS
jgi:hypothetical protein